MGHALDLPEDCAAYPKSSPSSGAFRINPSCAEPGRSARRSFRSPAIRVTCRAPGIKKATLQPGGSSLPITRTADGVEVIVNDLGMHAMVVFE